MEDFEIIESTPFSKVVQDLCTPGRDDNSSKTAAVSAALVEVIQEKLGATSFEKVSPAALFASALNALSSTVTSDITDVASSPQLSLLEILRVTIPYVSSSNPNLYLHQFSNTSRALRGVAASIPTTHQTQDQSKISSGWNALLRQCIRTSSTALNGILVLDNAKVMEKEVLKCFHSTILKHFDDSRAKVRRQAHSCALELLHLSNSLEQNGLYRLIPDHLVEYSHHILDTFIASAGKKKKQHNDFEKKEKVVRLMHLLSFLDSGLVITNAKGRMTLGKDLMKLLDFAIVSGKNEDIQINIMVANGALAALLQIFDNSNREFKSIDEDTSQEDAFCAQQWAALLQANVNIVAFTKNGNEGVGECRILYARAIVAITVRMLSDNISDAQKPVMKALVPKLLSLSFTTVINCVGDEDIAQNAVQSICAELGRLIRCEGINKMMQEKSISAGTGKCIESCVAAMQKILHYRFKSNWDASLPCLASLAVVIVQGMVPSSGADEETMAIMQSRVKPLVGGLVQLHADVDDKRSKQVVQGAIGTIVEGLGAEIFMGLVNLCDDSKDSKVVHGAVSNERAWILDVIKSSLSTDSNPYRPRLAFYQSHVLALARKCDSASASDNLTVVEASIQRSRVIDLWGLFPSFCLQPLDIEVTFPALAQTFVKAMGDKRYPELLVRACNFDLRQQTYA
jgi:phosphotransferase system HPr-like phosphotransfer protein